jgi:hypothetical protein
MIIDHPGLGAAIAAGAIQPLRRLVPREAAEEWKATSFVPTWDSYMVGGQPWALPVDAATQVSVFRPDLLPGGGAIIGFDDRVPAAGGGAGGQANLLAARSMGLEQAIQYEREMQAICRGTRDAAEGRSAFAEKRVPKFTGQ